MYSSEHVHVRPHLFDSAGIFDKFSLSQTFKNNFTP